MFFDLFSDKASIEAEFRIPAGTLDNCNIIAAYYSYEDYSGNAVVIYEENGQLYEAGGSHCSCNGLEDQWEPELVNLKELQKRFTAGHYSRECPEFTQVVLDYLYSLNN